MARTLLRTMLLVTLVAQLAAAQTSGPPASQGSQQGAAAPSATQPPPVPASPQVRPANPDPDLTPPPDLEAAIEALVERHLDEALGENRRGRGREMSPEMDQAITEKIRDFTMPGRPEMLTALLTPIAFFGMVALLGFLVYSRSKEKARARMEFNTQLMSKFTSGEEFAAFLNSKGSQRMLQGLSTESYSSKERILKRGRSGAVFTAVGLVLLVTSPWTGMGVLGVLCLAVGIGFLASALATYRLSEKLGLLRDGPSGTGQSPPPDQPAAQ